MSQAEAGFDTPHPASSEPAKPTVVRFCESDDPVVVGYFSKRLITLMKLAMRRNAEAANSDCDTPHIVDERLS